jgi:hypothetical protein
MGIDPELTRASTHRTVCEVTREIWDIVHAHREALGAGVVDDLQRLLSEQIAMQKKIVQRLIDVKEARLLNEMFAPNYNHDEDSRRRKEVPH